MLVQYHSINVGGKCRTNFDTQVKCVNFKLEHCWPIVRRTQILPSGFAIWIYRMKNVLNLNNTIINHSVANIFINKSTGNQESFLENVLIIMAGAKFSWVVIEFI